MQGQINRIVEKLKKLNELNRDSLARLVEADPDAVVILATCTGLRQEQLKNQLQHRLGTSGWVTLAKKHADQLIELLDQEFRLVSRLKEQLSKQWTFSDILLERYLWSRKQAASAVGQGRKRLHRRNRVGE